MTTPDLWRLKRPFILASASHQRRILLEKAGFFPTEIMSADIDESVHEKELPARYVKRIACQKAQAVAALRPGACIVAADTVIAVGSRIIRKVQTAEEAREKLKLLSGRRHRVMTGIGIVKPDGKLISKVVQTAVVLKKMDEADIDAIIQSGEWKNVAGYQIEGVLSACVRKVIGSYPNVVGLPIFEVAQILKGILR